MAPTVVPGAPAAPPATPVAPALPARLLGTRHPLLCEINARVWLAELGERAGRPLDLAEVPEEALDALAGNGFDLVWLMGVWTTGAVGRRIAREHGELRLAYDAALPGWRDQDVVGSPYSVQAYEVAPELGGRAALADLRRRLAARGIGLILDFVPNHTAIDHALAHTHPELYVQGAPGEENTRPGDFIRLETAAGPRVVAHGRDPYFPSWTDTLQVNALHPGLRRAHVDMLRDIGAQCDGVRCDMAMLVLNDVFAQTWGERATSQLAGPAPAAEYWSEVIGAVRRAHPRFIFMAEVYWQLESRILALGFNYAYDKTLYDRLRHAAPAEVDLHLNAQPDYQRRMVRFIENHDEDRAASAFAGGRWLPAATLAYTLPGLRLVHDGQLEGRRQRLPVQLGRRRPEAVDPDIERFYARLLDALRHPVFRLGSWHRLRPAAAWGGNASHALILAHLWDGMMHGLRLVAVNLGDRPAQCRLRVDCVGVGGERLRFRDLLGPESYLRERREIEGEGLFLDLEPYQAHVFAIEPEG